MSSKRIQNYLRLYRRRSAFTQKELAFLLGYRTQSIGSRFEWDKRRITLANAIAYHLIFEAEPKELFPALFAQVEDGVASRMTELHKRLSEKKPSKRNAAKLKLLERAISRMNRAPQSEP